MKTQITVNQAVGDKFSPILMATRKLYIGKSNWPFGCYVLSLAHSV